MGTARKVSRGLIGLCIFFGSCAGMYSYVLPRMTLLDGPFEGTPAPPRLTGIPYSSIAVSPELTLESYDPITSGTSALVQMRHQKKGILWSIHADGTRPGDTRRVEFKRVEPGMLTYVVRGKVVWTFGHEGSVWEIRRTGSLRFYHNSW